MSDHGHGQERDLLEQDAQADLEVPEEASEHVRGGTESIDVREPTSGLGSPGHKSVEEIT